jgi:hypothetical protein
VVDQCSYVNVQAVPLRANPVAPVTVLSVMNPKLVEPAAGL